jgi:D-alanine--poly(phosphoribitol) ligase subunit 2
LTQDSQDRIAGLIHGALGVDVPGHDVDLIETGLLDSLAVVSLITEIEGDFGFELPLDDFDLDAFRSVERMAAFVEGARP